MESLLKQSIAKQQSSPLHHESQLVQKSPLRRRKRASPVPGTTPSPTNLKPKLSTSTSRNQTSADATNSSPQAFYSSTHFSSHIKYQNRIYYAYLENHALKLKRSTEDLAVKYEIPLEGCSCSFGESLSRTSSRQQPMTPDDEDLEPNQDLSQNHTQFFLLDPHGKVWEFHTVSGGKHTRLHWMVALRIEIEWAHRVAKRDSHLEFGLLSAKSLLDQKEEEEEPLFTSSTDAQSLPVSPYSPTPILQEAVKNNMWFLSLKAQESNFNKTNDLHIQSVIKNFEKDKEKEIANLKLHYQEELLQKEKHLNGIHEKHLNAERKKWLNEIHLLENQRQESKEQQRREILKMERQCERHLEERLASTKSFYNEQVSHLHSIIDVQRKEIASLETKLHSTREDLSSLREEMHAHNVQEILQENTELKSEILKLNRQLDEQRHVHESQIKRLKHEKAFELENWTNQIENHHKIQMAELKYSLLKDIHEKEASVTMALAKQRLALESKLISLKFGWDSTERDSSRGTCGEQESSQLAREFYSGDALQIAHNDIERLSEEKRELLETIREQKLQHEKELASFSRQQVQSSDSSFHQGSSGITREQEEQYLRHAGKLFQDRRTEAAKYEALIQQQREEIRKLEERLENERERTQSHLQKQLEESALEHKRRLQSEVTRLEKENDSKLQILRKRHRMNLKEVLLASPGSGGQREGTSDQMVHNEPVFSSHTSSSA